MINVSEVDQKGLCLECGTCAGVCPHNNIIMVPDHSARYRIKIHNQSVCRRCKGFCLKACPGHEVDMDALNRQVFGKLPENYWAGNYLQTYLGSCSDPEIQFLAASGGIVSSLLAFALREKDIQGVFLLTPRWGEPFRLDPMLVTNIEQIKSAAGSFYWPAPIGQMLKHILHSDGRFAFVGLPCEIQALRKAQAVYPRLREKIVFSVGIYCGSRTTIQGQMFAMKRYGVDANRIANISYRHAIWPGHLLVTMTDGSEIHIPKTKQLQGYASQLICHQRCLYCNDSLADLADISSGDALRLEDIREPYEKSILVARTQHGLELIERACKAGVLTLRKVDVDKLIRSQKRPLLHKKQALWARIKAGRILGRNVPSIQMTRPAIDENKFPDLLHGISVVLLSLITTSPLLRHVLDVIPMRILRKHSFFNRYS